MKISIFGLGYVGCVSLGCLAKSGHTVIGVDISETKVNQINDGLPTIVEKDIGEIISTTHREGLIRATTIAEEAILQSDISFVAVGTPSTAEGHLNLKYIFKVADDIGFAIRNKNSHHIIVIRSTVLPGTCDQIAERIASLSGKTKNKDFSVVMNPEFLREGSAVADYHNPPLTLIGSDNKKSGNTIATIYADLKCETIHCDIRTAEAMKYVNNTFHALKISFANEVGNVCSKLGLDSHVVMEILCKDTKLNISPYYMKPGFAYGGSCLPKDLKGFQTLAHDNYIETPLLEAISKSNEIQIQRAIDLVGRFIGKKIGFLGLSFKAGTDDLRNSPAVRVIEALLGKGAAISIYDKNINLTMLTGTNKDFIDARIPHLSKLLTSDIDSLLSSSEVIVVNTNEMEFSDRLNDLDDKIIIDLVRLGDSFLEKENYIGINWSNNNLTSAYTSAEDTVLA